MPLSPDCPCCGNPCMAFDSAVILSHIEALYFRCPACGLVRTEDPNWLDEAYSQPITALDIGLLGRCLHLAKVTEAAVRSMPGTSRCLDWAGGYGVLTRLLRDRGLDFRHHDPHTRNLFATDLEGDPSGSWDLITLYEVFEHLTDPLSDLKPLSESAPVLLFTTELLPEPTPRLDSWWYYTPETGQHVTFYTSNALSALASRLGMSFVSDGKSFHAFYRPGALPRSTRWIIRNPRIGRRLGLPLRRARPTQSLLKDDFADIRRAQRPGP